MSIFTLKVDQENNQSRLDVFLAKNLPQISSRSFVQKLIESGSVLVNKKKVKAHHKVLTDDEICVEATLLDESSIQAEDIPLNIFYEDGDILIVEKPIGMTVHPARGCHSGTLVNALLFHCKNLSQVNATDRPGIVHRLDRETSGLMIVAKNNEAHMRLARQFEKRLVQKRYVALVSGLIEFDEGVIDASLGRDPRHPEKKAVRFSEAKEAKTFYRVLKRLKGTTLVALYPKTGRTHQLRVHMKYLGHPILGDSKYGKQESFSRLALHAQSIGFEHPRTKKYLEFSSKLPEIFLNIS